MSEKWTLEQVEIHIKQNVTDYGAAIVVSALFAKLYGRTPKIGLSGFQGETAIKLAQKYLPDAIKYSESPLIEGLHETEKTLA